MQLKDNQNQTHQTQTIGVGHDKFKNAGSYSNKQQPQFQENDRSSNFKFVSKDNQQQGQNRSIEKHTQTLHDNLASNNGNKDKNNQKMLKEDLRGSHFQLGHSNANNFATQNQMNFQGQKQGKEDQTLSDNLLRQSHFGLGNDDRNNYNTTHLVSYPMHPLGCKAKMSQETLQDLRSHHFKVGQYGPVVKTQYNLHYPPKSIQKGITQEQQAQKEKMRGHHHDFAEEPNKNFQSTYGNHYYKKDKIDKPIDAKQKNIELRRSNIILGKDYCGLKSTMQAEHDRKNVDRPKAFNPQLMNSNFQLGDQKNNYVSTNEEFFKGDQIRGNQNGRENEKIKEDLRQTHWQLGQEKMNYQSEMRNNFTKQKPDENRATNTTAMLQKDSWNQGNHPNMFKTVYAEEHIRHELPKQDKLKQMDRVSNFKIGGTSKENNFVTEFQRNFVKQEPNLNAGNEKNVNNNQNNVNFAEVKPEFTTTTGQAYKYNAQNMGDQNKAIDNNLRGDNFNLGTQYERHTTTYRRFMVPHEQCKGQLNQQQLEQLRRSHFQIS